MVSEVIVQLVTQTDPSSFSSLRVTCVRAYLFSNSRNATDAIYTRHRVQLYNPAAPRRRATFMPCYERTG